MKRGQLSFGWVLVVVSLLTVPNIADVVRTKSGDKLTGDVRGIQAGRVLLESGYSGLITLKQDQVATIETDSKYIIVFRDRTRTVSVFNDDIDIEKIQFAHSHPTNTRFYDSTNGWEHYVETGLSLSQGNSETSDIKILTESNLVHKTREYTLKNSIAREIVEANTTKSQIDSNLRTRSNYNRGTFNSLNLGYYRDPFKGVNSRVTTSAGLGYNFRDDSLGKLASEIGISGIFEEFQVGSDDAIAIRWQVDFLKTIFGGRFEAFHNHTGLTKFDELGSFVLASSSGLRYALTGGLDLNFRADIYHETDPPPDAENTDLTYSATLGVSF